MDLNSSLSSPFSSTLLHCLEPTYPPPPPHRHHFTLFFIFLRKLITNISSPINSNPNLRIQRMDLNSRLSSPFSSTLLHYPLSPPPPTHTHTHSSFFYEKIVKLFQVRYTPIQTSGYRNCFSKYVANPNFRIQKIH